MFDNAKDKEARAGDIQCCQALHEGCLRSAFLALFISCSLASDGFPTGACSVQDQACEIHEYNLVASLPGVASVEECRQLCSDDQHCSQFSYFGPTSFPIADVCFSSPVLQRYTHMRTASMKTDGAGLHVDTILKESLKKTSSKFLQMSLRTRGAGPNE